MRRGIITFLVAVAALCVNVAFAQEKPILTFGCLSDLHSQMGLINGPVENVRLRGTITNTLSAMKANEKLDLIVLGGDYTSDCTISEENWQRSKDLLVSATRAAFPAGVQTPVIYVDGNHEYEVANFDYLPKPYNAGEYYTTPMKQDIGTLSATDCFYESAPNGSSAPISLLAAYHYVVKGFDFVVLNTGKNYFKSAWDYTYSTESVQWCADKLAEIYAGDPDKTVFFLIHVPFSDSNSISNTNKGMNAGEAATLLKASLAKYPNLIMLYGHDHGKDTAYLRTSTDQRVTHYDTNGKKITENPDVSTSYYIQNYKNQSQYLAYNTASNMGVTTTKTEGTIATSSQVSGTMYISFPAGTDIRYLHCGSGGRFSGNGSLTANSSIYTYKVVDPSAATVVANKVSKIENGGCYVFVALSSAGGYYMLTDEVYGSGADQRMVGIRISATAPGNQITFTVSGSYSPVWKLTDTAAPDPVEVTYSVKNYNTSKYLGFGSWNITTNSSKSVCTFTPSTVTPGAFTIHIDGAEGGNPYLYCGTSGRFSGNESNAVTNSQVELFKVDNPNASTITATRVTAFKGGETYLLVVRRSEGYYMLTNEMYQAGEPGQRMIGQAVTISGGKITYVPGSSSALWTIESDAIPEPVDVTYSVRDYSSSKYLGVDQWNLATKSDKVVCTFTPSTVTAGAFTLHMDGAVGGNSYLYCGTNGRFSGNASSTLANSQVELFKVDNPSAATITGTKVTSFKGGETYLLVMKRTEGYYMLTNEMYQAGTDNQRMIGQPVTISGDKITYVPGSVSALWVVEANEAPQPPAATESFFSSFMGSMRYYSNSIEGDVSVSNSKIVQALMVYVYSDRVELHMKNYGQSGTFGSITINENLTPYVSYRRVTHSEEAKSAVPAFENKTTTGVDASETDAVNVYANAGTIYIKGFSGNVRIYNISGRIIDEINAFETSSVKTEPGIYIVKAGGTVTRVVVQ